MNIRNELQNGKGYHVFSIQNLNVFKKLKKELIKKINIPKFKKNDVKSLRKIIAKMTKAEVNKAMINLLTFNNLSEMIIRSCLPLVKELCGKEVFIQRRAHTIINLPGNGQAKQWPHYEMMSGISPHTYVIWAPLHDLDDDGGVYYLEQKKSIKIMKKEEKLGLVNGPKVLNLMNDQKPTKLKFGQAIIFNPFVIHGNTNFKSDMARIACNVRFQSCSKPLLQKNSDYLKYYKL